MRSALLILAFTTAVAAQTDVPPPKTTTPPAQTPVARAHEVAVTVEGCLENNRLMPSLDARTGAHEAALNVSEYKLEGPKEMMRVLTRDHKGHLERISGIATIPPNVAGAAVETTDKKIGKVHVETGVRQSGGGNGINSLAAGDAPLPVRLRVQAATHLDEHCVERAHDAR